MSHIYPDIEWYTRLSGEKAVSPRCPFATIHRCPRYYPSLALLGEQGMTTKILPDIEIAVQQKWEETELWPATKEESTGIMSSDGRSFLYSNLCPDVTGELFGLFASSLSRYADEIDKAAAQNLLQRESRSLRKDWRWEWASVSEQHFSQCSIYSLLSIASQPVMVIGQDEELFSAKPSFFGFSINLKTLLSRCARWWLSSSDKHNP